MARSTTSSTASSEARIQVGAFCLSMRFGDPDYAASVRRYYAGFLSDREPDLLIDVEIAMHEERIEVPNALLARKTVKGNRFEFDSGLLKGILNSKGKQCKIVVKNALLTGSCVRVFEQFLYQVYYTLLKQREPNANPNYLLIHASGVGKEGWGYVFTGPPMSGKSTIAALSSEHTILNDEILIVGTRDRRFYVQSTPFNGECKTKEDACLPLRAVFYLKQDERNYLEELDESESIRLFYREVIPPSPLLSHDMAHALSETLDFCIRVVQEMPFYVLHFLPDASFWECIEGLENTYQME